MSLAVDVEQVRNISKLPNRKQRFTALNVVFRMRRDRAHFAKNEYHALIPGSPWSKVIQDRLKEGTRLASRNGYRMRPRNRYLEGPWNAPGMSALPRTSIRPRNGPRKRDPEPTDTACCARRAGANHSQRAARKAAFHRV